MRIQRRSSAGTSTKKTQFRTPAVNSAGGSWNDVGPVKIKSRSILARLSARGIPGSRTPSNGFSGTAKYSYNPNFCGLYAKLSQKARPCRVSAPGTVIFPRVGTGNSAAEHRSMVSPSPSGPGKPVIAPEGIRTETPCKAGWERRGFARQGRGNAVSNRIID